MQTEDPIYHIIQRLRSVHRKEQFMKLHAAFMNTCSVSSIVLLAWTIIEFFAQGNIAFRTFLFSSWVILSLISLLIFTLFPIRQLLLSSSNHVYDSIASRVGALFMDIRDTLQNALQLIQTQDSYPPSALPFIQAAFEDVRHKTHEKDFYLIIDEQERKKSLLFMMFSLGVSILLLLGVSPLRDSLSRIMQYDVSFIPPASYSLEISPLNKTVLRGSKEEILITVKGTLPSRIVLHIKEEMQEAYDTVSIVTDTSHVYRYEIASAKSSLMFYAHADWLAEQVLSPKGNIIVIDRPEIRSLSGTVSPPSYSKQSGRSLDEQTADILGLKGTNVMLEITANKPLSKAFIVLLKQKAMAGDVNTLNKQYDTTKVAMNVQEMSAKGSFSIRQDGEYFISIIDTDGRMNADPIHYSITAISDNPPTISLIEPQGDGVLTEQALLPITVHISDDYGFGGLRLHYRLIESTYAPAMQQYASLSIPIPGSAGLSSDISYTWDLNTIGIAPSDKYEIYLEIIDNNTVTGPGRARTGVIAIRLPSLDEVLTQADSVQDKALETLEQTAKDAEKIGKELEELQRELLKQDQSMQWKDAKNIENILKKQSDLQQQLSEVSKQLQEMTNELQDKNAMSPETLQEYQKLQQLMKEVNSPELKKAMEAMQKAMQQIDPEQMRQAMKNMKFNEEEFKKGIERTMNLLKRMQVEQKADALIRKAQELARKQDELTQKTENTNPRDTKEQEQLSKNQEVLQKELKDLASELRQLEELMKELKQLMPMDELDKAKQELSEQQTDQQMEAAQQDMQSGQMNASAQKQKKASQAMKKFAKQMSQMKQQMKKNMNKEAIRQMQKSLQSALSMSKQQEAQKSKSQSLDFNSTQLPQSAQEQAKLQEQLSSMASELMQLAQKTQAVTPDMVKEMSNAMQGMQKASEQLGQRNPQMAAKSQGQAMDALNKASIKMQDALNKLQGEGDGSCDNPGGQGEAKSGSGGFMQQLQKMAGMQEQINQGMPQPGADGSLTPQQQQQLARLAGQQGKAQQAMQELAKQQQDPTGKKQALGDLQQIADEMKEIVSAMQSGSITPETRRRQEKILSRLLDATLSINERDFEMKRESRSGIDIIGKNPPPLDLATPEGRQRAMQDVLRSLGKGYTKDYEIMIRQYFERLQKTQGGIR
ncbi:MAG: hypothetical protein FJ212_02920 [Ignavibacteria bacterium]|nr:hypothetical protein [Ignavibacteria bacterium]